MTKGFWVTGRLGGWWERAPVMISAVSGARTFRAGFRKVSSQVVVINEWHHPLQIPEWGQPADRDQRLPAPLRLCLE